MEDRKCRQRLKVTRVGHPVCEKIPSSTDFNWPLPGELWTKIPTPLDRRWWISVNTRCSTSKETSVSLVALSLDTCDTWHLTLDTLYPTFDTCPYNVVCNMCYGGSCDVRSIIDEKYNLKKVSTDTRWLLTRNTYNWHFSIWHVALNNLHYPSKLNINISTN